MDGLGLQASYERCDPCQCCQRSSEVGVAAEGPREVGVVAGEGGSVGGGPRGGLQSCARIEGHSVAKARLQGISRRPSAYHVAGKMDWAASGQKAHRTWKRRAAW